MYNKKNLATIILFIGIFVLVLVTALTARRNVDAVKSLQESNYVENSYFKEVHYFKLNKLRPESELKASFLDVKENKYLAFVQPDGVLFQNKRKFNYSADSGNLDGPASYLKLEGDVKISDFRTNYKSDLFIYDGKRERMEAEGSVRSVLIDQKTLDKIIITSQKMTSWLDKDLMEMSGEVKGQIQRKRRYEGKLKFQADKMVFNQPESYVELDNSVKIQQNKMYLSAGNAEIFLENFNKKLKYYALHDDVRLEESLRLESGIYQKRRAYAEKLEAHQRTGKLILTGAPRVEQGSDTIKGYQITLRQAVEMIEVDDSQSNFKLKRED